jgi:hypothetical protein
MLGMLMLAGTPSTKILLFCAERQARKTWYNTFSMKGVRGIVDSDRSTVLCDSTDVFFLERHEHETPV